MRKFDRKFGKEAHLEFPTSPGIYRFYDEKGKLIYVGKAKNLRRRISQYRNARRLKTHLKMRKIVEFAVRVEHEVCESEFAALALEMKWIQEHRPRWNVSGAFYFMYPMIGVRADAEGFFVCYATSSEAFEGFRLHGAFRSRRRTREAFFALAELLRLIGHPVAVGQMRKLGIVKKKGTHGYAYGFRQVPPEWRARLEEFLAGDSFAAIEELALMLLERPTALAKGKEIQDLLHEIRRFWRHEIQALRRARDHSRWAEYPVAQKDRDWLFLALRSKGEVEVTPASPSARGGARSGVGPATGF